MRRFRGFKPLVLLPFFLLASCDEDVVRSSSPPHEDTGAIALAMTITGDPHCDTIWKSDPGNDSTRSDLVALLCGKSFEATATFDQMVSETTDRSEISEYLIVRRRAIEFGPTHWTFEDTEVDSALGPLFDGGSFFVSAHYNELDATQWLTIQLVKGQDELYGLSCLMQSQYNVPPGDDGYPAIPDAIDVNGSLVIAHETADALDLLNGAYEGRISGIRSLPYE